MTATALVAAVLGIVVGAVIGGFGGGGGVLTVPALVYVLGQDAHDATTGGVLIVGVTALVGTLVRVREGASSGARASRSAPSACPRRTSARWSTGTSTSRCC